MGCGERFYPKSHPSRLGKLLAYYELYQQVPDLPGAVIECRVYKGASLLRLAAFRALIESNDSRAIYGFDAFGAFPTDSVEGTADRKSSTSSRQPAAAAFPRRTFRKRSRRGAIPMYGWSRAT